MSTRFATILWLTGLWLTAFTLVACAEEPVAERFQAQSAVGVLGLAGAALRVRIDPGATPLLDQTDSDCEAPSDALTVAPFRLRMRSSAPTPTVVFDHGDRGPVMLELGLVNTMQNARFVPTVGSAANFGDCRTEEASGDIVLAPLPTSRVSPSGRTLCVALPRCGRLKVSVMPPVGLGEPGGEPLRVAVLGEVDGNTSVFDDLVELMADWQPHLLVSLGNLTETDSLIEIREWRTRLDALPVPIVTVLGTTEAEGGALLPFHDVFGRSDFSFRIGDVSFLVMDSASASFSEPQFSFWRTELEDAGPIRVVLTHTPPLDPAGFRNDGMASRNEAARLLALFGEQDVDAVFSAGLGTFVRAEQAGIDLYATGGGGRDLESRSDTGHHYLQVTIDPDAAEPVSVEIQAL